MPIKLQFTKQYEIQVHRPPSCLPSPTHERLSMHMANTITRKQTKWHLAYLEGMEGPVGAGGGGADREGFGGGARDAAAGVP